MTKKLLMIVIALGLAVGFLGSVQSAQAQGSIGDCGPNPTWGCIKCVYHPDCIPGIGIVKLFEEI